MAGDHKCPVCQATFTRPQHVARHMRSHTGDRPYKCQYCGDQFARSDLLSRHVNKCHSSEKPLPVTGLRRKGSASASRATTSKQACDQCVQSSLPCDGCNPCAKCVQRKCRCTFVKFHRQTAPTGPGHHPLPSLSTSPSLPPVASAPSSRLGLYSTSQPQSAPGPSDDFLLGASPHVPSASTGQLHIPTTMAENLYSDSFSFPPLYPSQSPTLAMGGEGGDFSSRYRAQAEMVRGAGERVSHPQQQPHPHPSFQAHRTPSAAWVPAWDQSRYPEAPMNDPSSLPPRLAYSRADSTTAPDEDLQHLLSTPNFSGRRPSLEFGSSDGSSSIPSSAASSAVNLPMEGIPVHQTFPSSALADGSLASAIRNSSLPQHHHHQHPSPDHTDSPDPSTSTSAPREGGFSSTFGLMSLDDPAVLAGLSSDGAPFFSHTGMALDPQDPNATPMPMLPPLLTQQRQQGKDFDAREMQIWKEYMRTPWSGPGSGMFDADGGGGGNGNGSANANGGPGTPGYRRPRVASLPSSKTPTASLQERFFYPQPAFAGGGGGSGYVQQQLLLPLPKKHPSTTTLYPQPDDLRSYEAAVMARRAPVTLSLKPPKTRRGNESRGGGKTSPSTSSSPSPQMPFRALGEGMKGVVERGGGGAMQISRPGSAESTGTGAGATIRSSSSSSSLANVFGRPPSAPSGMRVSFAAEYAQRAGMGYGSGSGSGSGSASPDVRSRSRESSVAVSDGSGSGAGSGTDGAGGGHGEGMRPSFKRLPSQMLGPLTKKRALVMRGGEDRGEGVAVGVGGEKLEDAGGGVEDSRGGEALAAASALETVRKDERPVVSLADRRRRMSAPTVGGGGAVPLFSFALGELP